MAVRALFITLLLRAGVCFGQDLSLPASVDGEVGGTASFKPLSIPPQPYTQLTWITGGILIIIVINGAPTPGAGYEGRASLDTNTLALELRNLTTDDEGPYTLRVQTSASGVSEQTTTLRVFERVSNVTITPNETELIEFNSSVVLTCSASGSSPSFSWLNESSEVIAGGRVQLTNGNRTLTITSVSRDDSGPFTCEAFNVINNDRSPPLFLTVRYGPDSAYAEAALPGPFYNSSTDLRLDCSAESSPAAEFQWAVNGTMMSEKGPELNLTQIQTSDSGNYTCIAHNTKTLRYWTSNPVNVIVLEKISGARIIPPVDPVEGSNVSLICEANGTVVSVEWTKNDQTLLPTSSITFSPDNRTVFFSPVMRSDSGGYICILSNPLDRGTADSTLTVNYGPVNTRITGMNQVEEGAALELKCESESVPEASYTWKLNDTDTRETTATYKVDQVAFKDSGSYTCTASNSITGLTLTSASHTVEVKEKGTLGGGGSLSTGAIVGIVIGVLLAVALIIGLTVYFTKCKGSKSSRGDKQNGAAQNGGETELNYADIQHIRKNNQSVVNMSGVSTQTRHGTPAMVRANRGARKNQASRQGSEA